MKYSKVILFGLLFWFAFSTIMYSQVTTIPPDREKLLNGEIMGQNIIAETNGFPSPQKVMELKDQIGLTRDQIKKINEMMTNLPVSVTVKGQEIVETEEELNKMFETGNVTERTLRAKLERISKLRADLRFSHLQIYLKIKQILSANQWIRLKELQDSEVK